MENALPTLTLKSRAFLVGLSTGVLCYFINNAFVNPVPFPDVIGPILGTAIASSGIGINFLAPWRWAEKQQAKSDE